MSGTIAGPGLVALVIADALAGDPRYGTAQLALAMVIAYGSEVTSLVRCWRARALPYGRRGQRNVHMVCDSRPYS